MAGPTPTEIALSMARAAHETCRGTTTCTQASPLHAHVMSGLNPLEAAIQVGLRNPQLQALSVAVSDVLEAAPTAIGNTLNAVFQHKR